MHRRIPQKKLKGIIRVLIAGVGGGSHGLEIIKALRLSDLPYYICGADKDKNSLGLFKADKGYCIPAAGHKKYIHAMLDICRREKIEVLFHGSEPDLKALSENRNAFEAEGVFMPFNTERVINLCMDKEQTFRFLKVNQIPIPKTLVVHDEKSIKGLNFFPVVIKPSINSGGSNNSFIAQNREELVFFCKYILKRKGRPLVQEYIGRPSDEYTVGVLSDKEGRVISCILIRRFILSSLSSRSKTPSFKNSRKILAISSGISQGEIVNNKEISKQCIHIALTLDSKGPLNIQCRFINNKVYPLEINPRFSGTTYMRALAGINEPDLLIRKYVLAEVLPRKMTAMTGLVLRGLEEVFIKK